MDSSTTAALDDLDRAGRDLCRTAAVDPAALDLYLTNVMAATSKLLETPLGVSPRAHYLVASMRDYDALEAEERALSEKWAPPTGMPTQKACRLLETALKIRMLHRIGVMDEKAEDEPPKG